MFWIIFLGAMAGAATAVALTCTIITLVKVLGDTSSSPYD